MGLSKIVPASQQHTGHITNPVGTPGYCDPLYRDKSFLTKESDVYSFGVVLLEVLCGKLCWTCRNGQYQVIVRMWEESNKRNMLQEIIFDDLKQQIDQNALKTFLDIAFKCLQKTREERPTMPDVVKELENALTYQELLERFILPENYKEMLMITEEDNLNNMPEMLLLKGIHRNRGKTWLSLNTDGERCEIITIAECLTSTSTESLRYIRSSEYNSRFEVGCYEPFGEGFRAHVQTQFLSPQIMYTVNLVFKRKKRKGRYIGLEYKLEGEKGKSYSFVSDEREDGWLTAELYQFISDQKTAELEILFYTKYCQDILVEGIEFQPLKKVELEELRDKDVDMQPKKDLCEGSLIKHFGEERFLFAKDGKKCLMLPAITVLEENKWEWKCLPETRLEEVADCISERFSIFCKFSSEMLSPKTTYAVYLVYKLPPDFKDNNPPVQVVDKSSDSKEEYNIFLRIPQTPVISWDGKKEKTFNPSSRPKIKGLPELWRDIWMEVQVYEFQTLTTIRMISTHLRFSSKDMPLKGIAVQGLEFRPV